MVVKNINFRLIVQAGRTLLLIGLFASIAFVFLPAHSASMATYTVTKGADTNDGNCDADCSLREAILAANQSATTDTISIPSGTYTLTITGIGENQGANGDLDILSDLNINGAGEGVTTIDANSIDRAFEITQTVHVTISGITIQNGLLPETEVGGGGILSHGTLQLTDSTLKNNKALRGAGIFNSLGSLNISGCNLHGNGDGNTSEGGGIYSDGEITISSSEIRNNRADSGAGLSGTEKADIILNEVLFDGNIASIYGGAIYNDKTVDLYDVTLSNNHALWGGGLFNNYNANLNSVTVNNNTAQVGAGIYNSEGIADVGSVTISTNTASQKGGGIYNDGDINIKNLTLIKNQAPQGGGIFNTNEGDVTFSNSILADNTLLDGITKDNCHNDNGVFVSAGYNLEDSNTCPLVAPGDQPNTNPNLQPLADNGGFTKTHSPNFSSPAIDAGYPGSPGNMNDTRSCTLAAQNHVVRPVDGDLNGSNMCDIGAVEKINNGLVAFYTTTFVSEEIDTAITFTVIRYSSDGPTSVSYSTPQNTEDIIPTSGTLNWTAGDTDPKTFNVTIVDDDYKEEDEVFSILLYHPTNGAGIEYPNQEAYLTILANDHGGTVETIPPHLPLIFR